jgi:hypothetical protein
MPAAGNESVDSRSNSREHNEQKNSAEEESFGSEDFSRPKEDRELCEDMEGIVCCVDFDVIHA